MRRTDQTTSVIVMTAIENAPPLGDNILPPPRGFCWRFVPEGPLPVQFRSILRTEARATVVWVGKGDAVDRAAALIGRLLDAGPPIVIAIAEAHEARAESVLRQAGAIYLCGFEAKQRLGATLEAMLGPPRQMRMDAG